MARETAAARNARFAAEREAELELMRDAYPQRFRNVLSAALNENFELSKVNPTTGVYTMYDRDESDTYEVFDTATDDVEQATWDLDALARAVEFTVSRREEFERQAAVRRNALAKLNPEERAALGL